MKKRFLFLIGSLSFFPIVTSAAIEYSTFSDTNLYKCVIDSYNQEQGTTHSYNVQLTKEQLSTIKVLNCNHSDEEGETTKI